MITRRIMLKGLVASLTVSHRTMWARANPADSRTPEALPLPFRSATDLVAAIGRKDISALELLDLYLERIERFNARINAVVALDVEQARHRARAADAAIARSESWGPLHGLPMTIKDALEVAGIRTTGGNPRYAQHVPTQHASAVQRLVAAGAVIFGKTNVPKDSRDWQTYNPIYGTTNNPWDVARTPGGSSGGAGAALAAGLTGLELGSDLGGSIRIPAHFCGVYGHKPTFGLVPRQGHIPPPPGRPTRSDLWVVGPMARAADDLALAMEVLTGATSSAGTAGKLTMEPPRRLRLRDYRVAAWLDDALPAVDDDVQAPLERTIKALREAGVTVHETARPGFSLIESRVVYRTLLGGVVFGAHVPSETEAERQTLRDRWSTFFQDYDVLLFPVAPITAFPHDQSEPQEARLIWVNGVMRAYRSLVIGAGPATVAYLPATVAPVGLSSSGLPVGVQIIGPYLGDRTTIDFARQLAKVIGGFIPPPGY